jgi:hypothetical protein
VPTTMLSRAVTLAALAAYLLLALAAINLGA